jgi:sec-independent protein translocase protein TatC
MNEEVEKLSFLEHLEEARKRIIASALAVGVFSLVGLAVSRQVVHLLISRPFQKIGVSPVTLNVSEAVMIQFKAALFVGMILAMPVIVYEIWMFIAPGLYPREKKVVRPIFWSMTFLFLIGAGFAYGVVLPLGLPILKKFTDGMGLQIMWSLGSCSSFSILMMIGFGVGFQLPLIMAVLAMLGVIDHKMLSKNRSIAVVLILIISALLTPPDGLTMILMSGPLWILYEASILAARLLGQREEREAVHRADSATG